MTDTLGEVRLRAVVEADRAVVRAIEDEAEGNALSRSHRRTDEQFGVFWDRVMTDPAVVARMIVLGEDGGAEAVGFVNSFRTTFELGGEASERRCVGYRVSSAWWGRGIATRALELLLAIEDERPLWAITAATNAASQRVLAKCGFEVVERRWFAGSERYPAGDEVVVRLR